MAEFSEAGKQVWQLLTDDHGNLVQKHGGEAATLVPDHESMATDTTSMHRETQKLVRTGEANLKPTQDLGSGLILQKVNNVLEFRASNDKVFNQLETRTIIQEEMGLLQADHNIFVVFLQELTSADPWISSN